MTHGILVSQACGCSIAALFEVTESDGPDLVRWINEGCTIRQLQDGERIAPLVCHTHRAEKGGER